MVGWWHDRRVLTVWWKDSRALVVRDDPAVALSRTFHMWRGNMGGSQQEMLERSLEAGTGSHSERMLLDTPSSSSSHVAYAFSSATLDPLFTSTSAKENCALEVIQWCRWVRRRGVKCRT